MIVRKKRKRKMGSRKRGKEHYQMFLMYQRYLPDLKQTRKRKRIMVAKKKSREKCQKSGSRLQLYQKIRQLGNLRSFRGLIQTNSKIYELTNKIIVLRLKLSLEPEEIRMESGPTIVCGTNKARISQRRRTK